MVIKPSDVINGNKCKVTLKSVIYQIVYYLSKISI